MENLTNSSNPQENQRKNSDTDTMSLIRRLYENREVMPMQAEPDEPMIERDNGTITN